MTRVRLTNSFLGNRRILDFCIIWNPRCSFARRLWRTWKLNKYFKRSCESILHSVRHHPLPILSGIPHRYHSRSVFLHAVKHLTLTSCWAPGAHTAASRWKGEPQQSWLSGMEPLWRLPKDSTEVPMTSFWRPPDVTKSEVTMTSKWPKYWRHIDVILTSFWLPSFILLSRNTLLLSVNLL